MRHALTTYASTAHFLLSHDRNFCFLVLVPVFFELSKKRNNMSATTLLTETEPRIAEFKFIDPDNSIGPDDRALFALPAVKEFKIESLPIRDYRSSPELVRGPAGLDKHGFTLVNHTSALSGDGWFSESALEDIYFDEVRTLVKNVTGAKDAVINSVVFRRKAPERSLNPVAYRKKGDELVDVKKIELNRPMGKRLTVPASKGSTSLVWQMTDLNISSDWKNR